ncbi:uncharacterized protein LOC134178895 [Corticium candelabrum]|uniref:uncharacterized protein LOC134178895 n=1 Tax=Corticium candelabrum TaxID=121492 RepID=UPI002E257E67|nr:uncharacterized protein LOC134178895 [Corticium candelabrum]
MKFLRKIVLDAKWMRSMAYYARSRHTGALENYHSVILKYAPKRTAFGFDAFKARCLLAALDHNVHVDRQHAQPKTSSERRFHRKYNKNSQQWTVTKVKQHKTYPHISQLMHRVLLRKVKDTGSVLQKPLKSSFAQSTIAPVAPPGTSSLVEQQRSRTGNSNSTVNAHTTREIDEIDDVDAR